MKKVLCIVFFPVFILFTVLMVKYGWIFGLFSPSNHAIEKKFELNKDNLNTVCDFLQKENYKTIRIELHENAKSMECYSSYAQDRHIEEQLDIYDKKVLECLKELKSNGFIRIIKEYNYICFETWVSFGESKGLMYSKKQHPDLSKINAINTSVNKLKEKEWFCYYIQYE